ncbi:CBS domain-containing protein [Flavobacteriaceae bacterium F08102]|nr:CBS domain-containing protein [Flavobacteriaceae bacterium F08102]
MATSDYISKDVQALAMTDTIKAVKSQFNKLTFTHLPIVKENQFIGLVDENDIQAIVDDNAKLSEFEYIFLSFYADKDTNWFELLKIFALNHSTIIPVVDPHGIYLGYYELNDILSLFNSTPFLNQNGSILVVSKGIKDYSFSEISQIIESNNARLLGAFISKISENDVEVTIKLSDHDLNNTIQTFRRYNYTILTNFQMDEYLQTLKERSDYLQKYLDI